ncbi:hypothetical protein D3C75_1193500 [compost metagenome]
MALWIKFLQPGPQHSDCLAANIQGSLMSCAIDTQCQATGHNKPGLGQAAGKRRRRIEARARRTATTDNRNLRFVHNGGVTGNE